MRTNTYFIFAALAIVAMLTSSCADFDFAKRKYRPGFHVDMGGKKESKKTADTANASRLKGQSNEISAPADVQGSVTNDVAMASVEASVMVNQKPERQSFGQIMKSDYEWFKNTLFNRTVVRSEVQKITKPMLPARNDWMAWACFGAGIASVVFGFFGILFAFLFTNPIWAAAIVFGVAAIVFGFIHKNNAAGGEKWRRIGFILGWVGLGLGLIGMTIYIAWIAANLKPLI